MKYTFVKVQCHPNVPSLQAWYLKIALGDFVLYSDVHLSVASQFMMAARLDPHNGLRKEIYGDLYHPTKLTLEWFNATQKSLQKQPILVNKVGGWMPYEEAFVIETQVCDEFVFPKLEANTKEIITIKR